MGTDDLSARLEGFLTFTEPQLSRLGMDRLQDEVLDRLCKILDADTATVLLHEQGTDYLVARAARGLEDEVRQGVRIPIGTGFAGRIADSKQPVRLRQVDDTTVVNVTLLEKGVQRMLGVPLVAGDDVLGVVHVGRLAPRDFDVSDEALLQIAAERLAVALQTRRYAEEAATADVLERSLLPSRLPRVPGVQFASRYVPAENHAIGGDWYDAFLGPDQSLWMVIGDVAGHGLRSAIVMGRVKSALRAYILLGDGPARVLELTDRKVLHFEMGVMITVACARSFPPYDTWTICSAGHPPPVTAGPDRPAGLVDLPLGPPLGAQPDCERQETAVTLVPGGVLLLYTDGLVERKGEAVDTGMERLRSATVAADPDVVCRTVMHRLVGSSSPADDIAVLAVQREVQNGATSSLPPAYAG